jgi:hypothetical protein
MRRLVWSLVVIVALLAILDRVALLSAQHDIAERLQADARLSSAPDVSIHGYPFLTQLVSGDYDDVDVVMHGLDSDDLRIDRLSIHVSGAHVSMGDVLSQDRSRVHVDHATAKLLITYADLATSRAAITRVAVTDGDTIRVTAGDVTGSHTLTGLPFGIRLTSAKVTQAGIEVSGEAQDLVIRS